jgi:Mg-chelatase subunit ChlD
MKNRKIKKCISMNLFCVIIIIFASICYGFSKDTDEIKKIQPDLIEKPIITETKTDGNSAIKPDNPSIRMKADIILVLDNSGSMKKNDPQFITKDVVTELLNSIGEGFRLGMVIFDQKAKLVEHLTDMNNRDATANFFKSLSNINYKGLFTDTPAGVERAIYELKTHGREDAIKILILLTDGIIDTGNKELDAEGEIWLKDHLAGESKKLGIKIFGIAFTDKADFRLMQILASKTGGEYFRAFSAEDIPDIFNKIKATMTKHQAEAEPVLSDTLKSVTLENRPVEIESGKGLSTRNLIIPDEKTVEPPSDLSVQKKMHETRVAENKKPVAKSNAADKSFKKQNDRAQVNYTVVIFFSIISIILIILLIIYKRQKDKIKSDSLQELQGDNFAYRPPLQAELIDVDHITAKESVSLILNKQTVRIGRDPNNDIIIPREFISSLHATIEYKNGYYYLEDYRSTNGTYLNNKKISQNSPVRLKSGDTIHFAKCEFRFLMHDQAPYGETVMIQK